jgi:predicted site-specific integrase-resolvase
MNVSKYISASQAKRYCNYSPSSLVKWADDGKIRITKTPGGKRFYHIDDIKRISGIEEETEAPERKTICYARVSSRKQKEDLGRQVEYLQKYCPDCPVIKDVGSGLNYNRKGLQSLLKKVASGNIEKVVVTYRDRLCRYGIELIDWIFTEHNVELVVLCKEIDTLDTEEFATDILDVCNYFVSKYNGKKAAKYRSERKRLASNKDTSES